MKFSLLTSVSSAAIGAALLLAAPGVADAALVCQSGSCTETLNVGPTANLSQISTNLETFTIDKFVPGINQHLKSVDLSLSGKVTSSGTVTLKTNAGTGSAGIKSSFSVAGGTGAPTNFPSLATGSVFATTAFNLSANTTANYTATKGFGPISSTISTSLSQWQAGSPTTFAALLSGLGNASYTGPAGGSAIFNADATSALTVTYNYTTSSSVPEPATMAVLGSALVGLGVIRRRRNKA